jgi:condensin complex subunit 2
VFDTVIQDLRNSYSTEKMDEISTSFCFICLLHLANEKGLKIEVGSEYDANEGREVDGDSKKVGDIWGLKVYRDPNATPAA